MGRFELAALLTWNALLAIGACIHDARSGRPSGTTVAEAVSSIHRPELAAALLVALSVVNGTHAACFFGLIDGIGSTSLALLKGAQSVSVYAVSAALFCRFSDTQCLTAPKAASMAVVLLGTTLYSLAPRVQAACDRRRGRVGATATPRSTAAPAHCRGCCVLAGATPSTLLSPSWPHTPSSNARRAADTAADVAVDEFCSACVDAREQQRERAQAGVARAGSGTSTRGGPGPDDEDAESAGDRAPLVRALAGTGTGTAVLAQALQSPHTPTSSNSPSRTTTATGTVTCPGCASLGLHDAALERLIVSLDTLMTPLPTPRIAGDSIAMLEGARRASASGSSRSLTNGASGERQPWSTSVSQRLTECGDSSVSDEDCNPSARQ
jgi:hypothetical protein